MKITEKRFRGLVRQLLQEEESCSWPDFGASSMSENDDRPHKNETCEDDGREGKVLSEDDLEEADNPCWDGYRPGAQSGKKTKIGKSGKRVANCEKISEAHLRRIIKEEKEKLISEQRDPFTPAAEGLKAVKDMYDAVDRLTQAIRATQSQSGGMMYDSMDLAMKLLDDMRPDYALDRIEDRLQRVVDAK